MLVEDTRSTGGRVQSSPKVGQWSLEETFFEYIPHPVATIMYEC